MFATSADRVVSFGPFHLHLDRRMLLEGERSLRVGSRALEVLVALVERAGELVGKDELMARVWPKTTVEESNLKVHIAALRRTLSDGQNGNRYILTVPGRGYRFVATITVATAGSAAPVAVPKPQHTLPSMVTRLAGRTDVIGGLVRQLSQQHLVTIVGAGGVGITSVVLATAGTLLSNHNDGAWLVDLAPLADPRLVLAWLATTLGLELHVDELPPGLLAPVGERHLVLILDGSEHVFGAMADSALAIGVDQME